MSTHTYPMPAMLSDTPVQQPAASSARYWGQRLLAVVILTWGASFVVGVEAALVVLTIVGFGAAIAGLRNPALGLLGIGILCTIDSPARALLLTGGLLRFNTFNYWLLIVMILSIPFLLRLKDPQTRLLQAFILLMGLQLAVTTGRVGGVFAILNIVTLFGLLVYFAAAFRDRQAWYWLGIVCGTVSGLGGMAFLLQLDQIAHMNPNSWAFFPLTGVFAICLSLPFASELSQGRFTLQFLAVVSLAIANLVWIFLSTSRGVFTIAAVCAAYLVFSLRGWSRRLGLLAVVMLVVIAVPVGFSEYYERAVARFERLVDPEVGATTRTSGRYDLAVGGWHIFLDNPFGVGTGGFRSAWARLGNLGGRLGFERRAGLETPAHSGWIRILAENGVVGFLVFAAYVASFAFVGFQRSRHSRDLLLLGGLTSVALAVAFASTEFTAKGLWFLAAGVTVLLQRLHLQIPLRGSTYPGVPAGARPSARS